MSFPGSPPGTCKHYAMAVPYRFCKNGQGYFLLTVRGTTSGKLYDFKNPVIDKVYLESLDEKDGKVTGKAIIFVKRI